jgi:tetratricopeptide (TPR) repeat protein
MTADKGRYDDAITMLKPAAGRIPLSDAALELGLLYQKLGRTKEATPLLNVLSRASNSDQASLTRAGRATAALGEARNANALFRSASATGSNPALDTYWGLLFLEKYNRQEAVKSFQQALKQDPEWAPLRWPRPRAGRGRSSGRSCRGGPALEIDPHLSDAQLLLAGLDLDNTDGIRRARTSPMCWPITHRTSRPARWPRPLPTFGRDGRHLTPTSSRCWRSIRPTARFIVSRPSCRRATIALTKRLAWLAKRSPWIPRTPARTPSWACT